MIMPRGQPLLLPAKPLFVFLTLALAFLWELLPLGQAPWRPDILCVVLLFWCLQQPQWVNLGMAFIFGLLMDIQQGGVLGLHSFVYCILTFLVLVVQNRIQWYSLIQQAPQMFGIFFLQMVITQILGFVTSGTFSGWLSLLSPFLQAFMWPIIGFVLLTPQRKAFDTDAERPL